MVKNDNVAIIFGGGMNGLGLVRNLGRNGVRVYCVSENVNEVTFSRYCNKYFIVRNIKESTNSLRSFLSKIKKDLKNYAILIPTSDLFALNLSNLKYELEGDYNVLLPNVEVVKTLVEKKQFYRSLIKNKVPHPKTYFPTSLEEIKELKKEIKYPIFIKPSISPIFSNKFNKKGFLAKSYEELIHYYLLASKYKIDVVLQDVIPGPSTFQYGIAGYFDKHSNPKAFFAYHRLRSWPPMFGNSSLMESIPISDVASSKKIIERYLHDLGYHGIMDAEFKWDSRDGIFKLIEINARSWWQNSFPSKCGINIILMAYLDSIGKELKYTEDYEAGIKWSYFLNDIRSLICTRSDITIKDWINSLKGIKDWAYFSVDDFLPWIASNFFTFARIISVSRAKQN